MRRQWVTTLVILAGSVLAHAQNRAQFRTETNYVEADVVVTDRDGRFVSGLTAVDFLVREQRQPQSIASFTYIDLPVGPNAVSTTPTPVLFRPDLPQAQRVDADRIYLIYLNGIGQPLIRARATEFVKDFMQPRDFAAVWDVESTGQSLIFTNDKTALMEEIGRGFPLWPSFVPRERGQVESQRLRDAIDWLTAVQGRRKSLILFTEGWTPSNLTGLQAANRERAITDWLQGRTPGLTVGGTWLNPTDITGQSDVHIYSYDVRGLVATAPGSPLLEAGSPADRVTAPYLAEASTVALLRTIADQTGGRAFVESNDYRQGFARIVEDNSRYYILGYYSANAKRDGVFRTIDVRVTRPGLKVRARSGYVAR